MIRSPARRGRGYRSQLQAAFNTFGQKQYGTIKRVNELSARLVLHRGGVGRSKLQLLPGF
jgi:hypothetical protein